MNKTKHECEMENLALQRDKEHKADQWFYHATGIVTFLLLLIVIEGIIK